MSLFDIKNAYIFANNNMKRSEFQHFQNALRFGKSKQFPVEKYIQLKADDIFFELYIESLCLKKSLVDNMTWSEIKKNWDGRNKETFLDIGYENYFKKSFFQSLFWMFMHETFERKKIFSVTDIVASKCAKKNSEFRQFLIDIRKQN